MSEEKILAKLNDHLAADRVINNDIETKVFILTDLINKWTCTSVINHNMCLALKICIKWNCIVITVLILQKSNTQSLHCILRT